MIKNLELYDIKIVPGTFISFTRNDKGYIILGNKCGLKSLLYIFNKLKFKKYNFVRLYDLQLNDTYTNHPDCFFDSDSLPLEMEKVDGIKGRKIMKYYNTLFKKEDIIVSLTKEDIDSISDNLGFLIKENSTNELPLSFYDEVENKEVKIIIRKAIISPVRKY